MTEKYKFFVELEYTEVADEVWKRLMAKLQSVSRSEDYTPMEVQLALADIEARFGMDYYRWSEISSSTNMQVSIWPVNSIFIIMICRGMKMCLSSLPKN